MDFIYTPLVVDYLRLKFSAGLPNPFRETKWRREHGRVDRNLARFMLDDDESKLVVYILQGGCADSPRQAAANQKAWVGGVAVNRVILKAVVGCRKQAYAGCL